MKKGFFVFLVSCCFSITAFGAKSLSQIGIGDTVAPTVQSRAAISTAPVGQILFDISASGFYALDPSGNWDLLANTVGGPRSEILYNSYNGTGASAYGSVSTAIVYLTNTSNSGTAFTDASSSTAGTVVTINETGLYVATASLIGAITTGAVDVVIGSNFNGGELTGAYPASAKVVCNSTVQGSVTSRQYPSCSGPFTVTSLPANIMVQSFGSVDANNTQAMLKITKMGN